MGRFEAAAEQIHRALALLDGRDDDRAGRLRVRILITGAWASLENHGLTSALEMLRDARQRADDLDDDLLRTLSRVQESVVRGRAGDWQGAVDVLGLVGEGEHALNPSQRCALHINRGWNHIGLGDTRTAQSALEQALEIAVEHGLAEQEFKARHNLAHLAHFDGDLARALTLLREADAMEVSVVRDRARVDHAEVLLEAGLVDGARQMLGEALATAQHTGHRLEEGEISLRLAKCDLLVSDLDGARRHVRSAMAAYRTRQAVELVHEAQLIEATIDVAEERDLPTVVATLSRRSAHRPLLTPSDREAARLAAEALVLLGDTDGAERRLVALEAGSDGSLAATLHDVLVRARLDLTCGRDADAAARLVGGNRILAAHQFQSASLDVRAGMALHGRRLAALDVERSLSAADAAGVLTTVERWRAISHRINPVTPSTDPELATLTRELRRLRALVTDGDGGAGLTERVAAVEKQVAQREWSLVVEGSAAAGAPITTKEARDAAARLGATVVEFFESGRDLYQVILTEASTEVVRVGTVADVVALVTRLRRDLRGRAGLTPGSPMAAVLARATASSLAAVDTALNPSGAAPGRVVVVPSRALAAMPWSLMPSLRGRPVTTAPSLTRWVRGPADSSAGPAPEPVAALYGPGLARTAPEIRAVLDAWGQVAPPDLAATPSESVVAALATARVVHIAAHGTHEAQSPLFSSMRMADGPVFAHELPRPVSAEHVILSACDVGQFSTRAGDEPLGLSLALLSLGATSVLAAVAPVADDVAHDAMVAYHGLLAGGADAAQAWAEVVEAVPAAGVFCYYGSDWTSVASKAAALRPVR